MEYGTVLFIKDDIHGMPLQPLGDAESLGFLSGETGKMVLELGISGTAMAVHGFQQDDVFQWLWDTGFEHAKNKAKYSPLNQKLMIVSDDLENGKLKTPFSKLREDL